MKILMISNMLFPLGGVETYMISVGENLKKMGNEVQYFGMKDDRNIVGNEYNIYKKNIDFRKKDIRLLTYPLAIIYSMDSKRKIKKLLKYYKPDIVHLNTINFNITPSIISTINKKKIPIIKTIHDAQIACPNHRLFIEHRMEPCTRCIKGNYTNCFKNKCVWNSRSKSLLAMIESYLYRFKKTYHKIDKYILPSKFMLNIHQINGIPIEKMEYIINFSRMSIDSKNQIEKKNYVLYFGRISAEKGIQTYINVIKKMSNIKFVFVGNGPLVDELKGIDNIEYLGFKTGDELVKIIMEAKFSVYPSEWYENSPLSVLESQALGTPVIAANIGGIPELVSNKTGLLFKSGSSKDLEEKISKLYNDSDLLNRMSESCKNDSIVLDINHYCNKLVNIYENIIKDKEIKL